MKSDKEAEIWPTKNGVGDDGDKSKADTRVVEMKFRPAMRGIPSNIGDLEIVEGECRGAGRDYH